MVAEPRALGIPGRSTVPIIPSEYLKRMLHHCLTTEFPIHLPTGSLIWQLSGSRPLQRFVGGLSTSKAKTHDLHNDHLEVFDHVPDKRSLSTSETQIHPQRTPSAQWRPTMTGSDREWSHQSFKDGMHFESRIQVPKALTYHYYEKLLNIGVWVVWRPFAYV